MNYKIIATPKFRQEIKRLSKKFPSLKIEYEELIESLQQNPVQGTSLGNNCYKIRLSIASKGKGKSGGARAITYVFVAGTTVFLLHVYDKSEQSNITDKELKNLLKDL